jgi:hypothetical protein
MCLGDLNEGAWAHWEGGCRVVIKATKSAGLVTHVGIMGNFVGKKKLIVKNPLLKPGVDVRMILKWIVKMEDGRLQSGFI